MACCYSKLEETDSGIACIRGLLEDGFDDFATLRTDPDLDFLRCSPDFSPLLNSFEGAKQGPAMGIKLPFGGGDKEQAPKQPRKKSWLDPW